MTGTVKGYEITTNRNSMQKVLMLQVEISSPDDVQLIEFYNPGGTMYKPPVGSIVQILENGSAWKVAIAANDGIDFDETLEEGERLIYGDGKTSNIKLLADGTIKINSPSEDWKTIFDEFIDAIVAITTTGSPTNHALSPTSTTQINAIKTRMATLWSA